MTEIKTKKIQPVISEKAYNALLYMRVEERSTMTAVIERAIREYAENHCPQALQD